MMEISLTLPAVLASRHLAIAAVEQACRDLHGLEDLGADHRAATFTHQAVSALVEAFNNVVIHGHPGGEGEVSVLVKAAGGCLQLELRDHGQSFDFAGGERAAGESPATEEAGDELFSLSESGMGLYIIRSFMDEVHYQAGSPNILRMTKQL